MSPQAKRAAEAHVVTKYKLSVRSACGLVGLYESTRYYKSTCKRTDEDLRLKISQATSLKTRWGRPRIVWYLKTVKGVSDNHKRIGRVYREMGLQLGKRKGTRRMRTHTLVPIHNPKTRGEIWAMDFMSDQLANGRRFRTLNIVDLFTHEAVAIEVEFSLTGDNVAAILSRLGQSQGLPKTIVCDNGTEFTSKAMDKWAFTTKVELAFIQPGKPNQNAYCESFNARVRDECLNVHWFTSIEEAKNITENYRKEFNYERPHSSLKNMTPIQFANLQSLKLKAGGNPEVQSTTK